MTSQSLLVAGLQRELSLLCLIGARDAWEAFSYPLSLSQTLAFSWSVWLVLGLLAAITSSAG